LIPYLILADVQNMLLSALLTFSDRPLYAHYVAAPRLGNLSALDDQAAAGVMMWVPGSVAYLVPLCVIGIRLLFGGDEKRDRRPGRFPVRPKVRTPCRPGLHCPLSGKLYRPSSLLVLIC